MSDLKCGDVELNRDEGGLVRDATQSHIKVKNVYNPEDVAAIEYETEIADPGQYPFTRGLYPNMYRERLWLKSFIVSYSTPEETNEAFKSYIKNGMNDLRLLADLPIQSGIDPDHPCSWNSMMCGGMSTYAINVYEKMLEGIPLEGVTYELAHQNVSSSIFFHGMLFAMMEKRGLNTSTLKGNGICDPIRAKLVYASPDWPTEINRRVCLDHIEFCNQNTPKWKAIAPNGVDPCQAGMNAIQEIGVVLAVASATIEDLQKRGISIDDYGSMVVSLDAESDFFENIAKFRAIRKMWAKIAKEKFGAKTKKAMHMKIGIRTSGLSLQWQKPLNNASRVAFQILSCVFGGVGSIDASSIDEAVGLPSYEARMYNLDTQHIITHEANIALVADPLGGSYYLEWMTDKFEKDCNEFLKDIEERGGIYECLDTGWLNAVMEENRLKIQREKAEGKRLIIGVNSFKGEEGPINKEISNCAYKVPTEEMRADKIKEIKEFRETRNKRALFECFRRLYLDTKEGRNISRAMIDGIKEGMTMGEMCGIVRLGYGIGYDPMEMLPTPDYVQEALKECL
ncbi:acyl-CoA mutase large subunit family protein [Sporomusa sp. KB1]|jgi:methylmalonyl-CoA mutase N-terminal domain/subunit|uniref:acyl-CoA mutase large subunit family protein n=1 Tax=Sporomusa sp. KB1 TaxID=943346 RepID=UPI0011A5189C|nr:acyl-CoA mutase large subunit family protein [Sporomusa sp. KB1]TWH45516.1 methylmalonyl-CoA mutase N-terminal domain/subunit [Sporomusa sp. KB1]